MTVTKFERTYHLVETFTLVKEYLLVFVLVLAVGYYTIDHIKEIHNPVWQKVLISFIVLVVVAVLFFNLFPIYLVNKEIRYRPTGDPDKSYFTTTPRADDDYHLFTSGYEQYLKWLRNPKAPILYLTGSSGTGKSSLINAFLAPALEKENAPKTNVYVLRSYRDPLKILYEALRMESETDEDVTAETVHKELKKISNFLSPGERVLIILDQFEEFFLLRNSPATQTGGDEIRSVEELKSFFRRFINDTPTGVTILLAYRDDFQQLIDQLELPARSEHTNFEQVNPLSFDQGTKFLKSCPGLVIPDEQLNRTLREAASIDSPMTMRPIVLNLLGIILQQMVGPKSTPRRSKNLIRSYIIDSLGKELKFERATVLKAMLTDFNTARPRTLEEMSKISKLSISQLDRQMIALQHYGLVRCLDPTEPSQGKRKWQIAHDFIALQLEKVVYGVNKTVWQRTRLWIAPLLLGVLTIFTFSYFGSTSQLKWDNAIDAIEKAKFSWIKSSRTIMAPSAVPMNDSTFKTLLAPLIVIQPDTLQIFLYPSFFASITIVQWFEQDNQLTDLSGLDRVTSLKKLSVFNAINVKNLDGLRGLENLATLDMTQCTSLTNVDGLANLTGLKRIYFNNVYNVSTIDSLGKLVNLTTLMLNNDTTLQNIDVLKRLQNLVELDLSGCSNLKDINVLKELKNLRKVNLSDCSKIPGSQIRELKATMTSTEFWPEQ